MRGSNRSDRLNKKLFIGFDDPDRILSHHHTLRRFFFHFLNNFFDTPTTTFEIESVFGRKKFSIN